jgi:hypothetical protein
VNGANVILKEPELAASQQQHVSQKPASKLLSLKRTTSTEEDALFYIMKDTDSTKGRLYYCYHISLKRHTKI